METVERDYSPKGVKFYYIYKALAHPEQNGYVAPFNLKERLLHVAEAKRQLGMRISWLCDSMDNDLKHALGNAPNSEFLIDPKGKIIVSRPWSRPEELRADLAKLLGAAKKRTTIADVGMTPVKPPTTAAKGIVPRINVPGRMTPVVVKPVPDERDRPFYAKLRAEMGNGKLYLGFFLDPLYKVHWNNKVKPLSFEITTPAGVKLTPATGKGPKVEEAADADPREFLLDVAGRSNAPLKLTVKYFACDDAETFCTAMTQEYEIRLERDPDGGNRRAPRGNARRPGQPPAGMQGRIAQMLKRMDANGDGRITKAEARGPLQRRFDFHDTNRDGVLDERETKRMLERISRGR